MHSFIDCATEGNPFRARLPRFRRRLIWITSVTAIWRTETPSWRRRADSITSLLFKVITEQPEISPIYGQFDPDFPPTLVTTGTRDLLLSSCVRLARVMRDAGAPIDLRVWEGMWHVFEFYSRIPEAEESLNEISDFLNLHL